MTNAPGRAVARAALLLAAACWPATMLAGVDVAGFGTIGLLHQLQGLATPVAGVARGVLGPAADARRTDAGADSAIGLQADIALAHGWRSAAQVMLRRVDERDPEPVLDTLFVAWAPTPALELRVGRLQAPVYAASQSRRVDISHPWLRPPQQVYGLAQIERVDAVDMTASVPLGSTHLELGAIAGRGDVQDREAVSPGRDIIGLYAGWEPADGWRLRAGVLQARVLRTGTPADHYGLGGLGLTVDDSGWIVRTEWVARRSRLNPRVNASGAYLLLGHRLGNWTPYAMVAQSQLGGGPAGYQRQRSEALGLRHDLGPSLALKAQLEHLSGTGQPPSLPADGSGGAGLTATPSSSTGSALTSSLPPAGGAGSTQFSVALNFLF